jgi:hypothetical protein
MIQEANVIELLNEVLNQTKYGCEVLLVNF